MKVSVRTRVSALFFAAVSCGTLGGCGDSADAAFAHARSTDPAVVAARDALDRVRIGEARSLVDEVKNLAGAEGPLLEARLAALEGRMFDALALARAAAEASPGDSAPAATLVEMYAWDARLSEAQNELQAAVATYGRTPELVRAHGVLGLCTPGGAASGLEMLLEARRMDPTLPFVERALGEGHVLAAHAALGTNSVDAAAEHARHALEFLPGDVRAREALADALGTGADLDGAVEIFEALHAEGQPVREKLLSALHNAATATMIAALALPNEEREAIDDRRERLYLRMLALGAPRSDLGHGAQFLSDRAVEFAHRAVDLADAVDVLVRLAASGRGEDDLSVRIAEGRAKVRTQLERALALDPHCLMARGVLGELRYDEGEFAAAAEIFAGICNEYAGRLDELPLPIHMNAARAWARAGATDRARDALRGYLATNPSGRWVHETSELLESL
jgi:tetratricopeptide (TPR) repeat protein